MFPIIGRSGASESGWDSPGSLEPLFAEMQRQLETHNVLVKRGRLIDAAQIQAAARRLRKEEGKTTKTYPDAHFGADNERGRFELGYKAHIGMDADTGLVLTQVLADRPMPSRMRK